MKKVTFALFILSSAFLFSGCKQYEYRLVKPVDVAQNIPKQGISVAYDPLTYRITHRVGTVEMRLSNPTDTSVRLVSEKSYLVDPAGATHSIRSFVVAPHAFVDISFPPVPAYYYGDAYPQAGFYWSPYWTPYWYTESYYTPPRYHIPTQYDWEWKEGPVRMNLAYEQGSRAFEHNFTLTRKQIK